MIQHPMSGFMLSFTSSAKTQLLVNYPHADIFVYKINSKGKPVSKYDSNITAVNKALPKRSFLDLTTTLFGNYPIKISKHYNEELSDQYGKDYLTTAVLTRYDHRLAKFIQGPKLTVN